VLKQNVATRIASKKIAYSRVVVFFANEEEARRCIPKLGDAMWGDFKLCVLLPNTGVSLFTIMDDFKSNQTSVMLATANSVRGLDFERLEAHICPKLVLSVVLCDYFLYSVPNLSLNVTFSRVFIITFLV